MMVLPAAGRQGASGALPGHAHQQPGPAVPAEPADLRMAGAAARQAYQENIGFHEPPLSRPWWRLRTVKLALTTRKLAGQFMIQRIGR